MGKPVAFDARAEDRLTRGIHLDDDLLTGGRINGELDVGSAGLHPTRRRQANAASRISWYSTSERVWAGATVIESPVCTPIGSRFSIGADDHAVVGAVPHDLQLEFLPAGDRLLDQDLGDGAGLDAVGAAFSNSSAVEAMPVPRPPRM